MRWGMLRACMLLARPRAIEDIALEIGSSPSSACAASPQRLPPRLRRPAPRVTVAPVPRTRYHPGMAGPAEKVFEDALALSDEERLDLAERLLSSLPTDAAHLAELERRARRALAEPDSGEPWDVVQQRLSARFAHR